MEVSLKIPEGKQVIEKYGNGRFMVSDHYHEGSILVLPDLTEAWSVQHFSEISLETLNPFVEKASEIEVLIIGCGAKGEFITPTFRNSLKEKGLIVDAMDTGAACRTYNVLLSEGRNVAAALIAVD
ncbi:Mth938-like domain-containing protein [Kiloniella majae]|uniref:Mth938-like domain-containing protein n=1 Tax=Kiloniella majae TaxID=1938558 RepID=UPI000A278893|nr:Mth938-like domain-containing protein [Kiloniella majae]